MLCLLKVLFVNRAMCVVRILSAAPLLLLAACEGSFNEEGDDIEAGGVATSELVSSSVSPSSDVAMSGIWAGGGSAPIHGLMDDGVSFAASDRGGSFARSAPARASSSLTLGYGGAQAGGASTVVVNYDGWAINGGAGSLRVKLYDGATLIATGTARALTTTPANFSETFASLDVVDARLLRTELVFENSAAAGSLVSSIIWLDVTSRRGTGLLGRYFNSMDLTGTPVSRVDPTVDFNWGTAAPFSGVGADTFSARWTGKISADHTETYTFYTHSDDGVRLSVNGTRIIDNWTNHGAVENSGTLALQAGQPYDIELEYYENTGDSVIRLSWSSPSTPKGVIPQENLFPDAVDTEPVTRLACPAGFTREVFRDDFDGTALDDTKWNVIQGNNHSTGGAFTQLTKMLRANVQVEDGKLKVSSKRHCVDPYPNITPEHPARCAGTNYYSGAWLKGKDTFAPGKGVMAFHAKMPAPMPGTFPALWARNSFGDARYGELDLIETWWDSPKGTANDPNKFSATTHLGSNPMIHTSGNEVGPFANLVTAFHVWEVEWDADAVPAVARYYYRDSLGSPRILVRTANYQTSGFNGKVTDAAFRTALADGWRPYIDFAVQPEGNWNVGPDTAANYDPQDLEVDSVIICAP